MGFVIVQTLPPNHWVQLGNQLPRTQKSFPPGPFADLVHEVADRFLPWERLKVSRTNPTTDFLDTQLQRTTATLDLVSKKLESLLHIDDPGFLGMQGNA